MSRYGDSNWEKEDLFNSMQDFLRQTNSVAALMEVLCDVIKEYESD